MNLYKEYKADEDARRITKQINCPHILKIQLTIRCCQCGRLNTKIVTRDELNPSLVDCLCISKRTVAY